MPSFTVVVGLLYMPFLMHPLLLTGPDIELDVHAVVVARSLIRESVGG